MHPHCLLRWAWLTTDRRQTLRQAVGSQLTAEARRCQKQRAKAHLKRLIPGGMFANWIPHTEMIWGPQVTTVGGIALCPVGWAIPAHGTRLPTAPVSPASPLHGPDWFSLECGAGGAVLVRGCACSETCKLPGTCARALASCQPTSHFYCLCSVLLGEIISSYFPRLCQAVSLPRTLFPSPPRPASATSGSVSPGAFSSSRKPPGASRQCLGPRPSLPSFQVIILAQDSPLVSVPRPHR